MDKYFTVSIDSKVVFVGEFDSIHQAANSMVSDFLPGGDKVIITEKSMSEFLGNLENFMKTKTNDYCAIMWDCEVIELKANNFDDAEDLVVDTGLNDWMIADSKTVQIFIDNIKKVL